MSNQRPHILFSIVGIAAGTGTFCKSLGAGLRKLHGEQFRVSLLTFRPDALKPENAANFDEAHVLATDVHEDWRRAFELPRSVLRLRRKVRAIAPDLVFSIGTFANVVTSLAVKDVPVVLSDHLNMTQRLREARFGRSTRFFMRCTYRDRLMIVASHELADDLRRNFNVNRFKVIPNGIDSSVVRSRAAEAIDMPLTGSQRYLISVGRLTPQKDPATLLRAYAIARRSGLMDELLIAGDGELRPMLESLAAELGISASARFLGHCPNPYPLIRDARALVLSSIWEGFAYVPIEAMALGVPVISTACPSGPAEVLGNGEYGLLVPPSDPDQLAAAMLKLSQDRALHAHLSAKSLERAEQLSIENMAGAYRDAFLTELHSVS